MKLREHKAALITLIILTGCHDAGAPPPANLHPALGKPWKGLDRWFYPEAKTEYRETGLAQTYTRPADTSLPDGEIWSAAAMTGAHQTLQLPALVWVENLSNGRAVKIRLNDRGPMDGRRILAVTPTVARILGMEKNPTPVRITLDRQQNAALGYDSAAMPDLGIASPGRGTVTAQSLDGRDKQVFDADAGRSKSRKALSMAEALPQTYIQNPVYPIDYYVVLGSFYQHRVAARVATRCQALVTRDAGDGSNPAWQVVYGPFLTVEKTDDAQSRAQKCGISNPRLLVR
ncbi:hypothetical protein N5W20_03060 [Candidatus Kirkpatrickella diaphorinae]|uniref:RlpA-like protein double-psi beta-barrel domain-containing protein n=1 Tax=Candidatus Kirkpatrickella diaphorinae TaxID=2984322 RepID=A0ABY6GM71_9PROT|nr:RlpA-like double-psi beta-barrel domain-containing protein [Candidatus Kirkpatrickella diaphorinae]UYH51856.1 hypothetical protein N5W20_03060 [Candidatus Kirkpatrickella diaphorinae]